MNALTLKALLLSVITEMKFGQPLAKNAILVKKMFKKMAGLKLNASNLAVLQSMKQTYIDNGLEEDFNGTLTRMKATHLLPA